MTIRYSQELFDTITPWAKEYGVDEEGLCTYWSDALGKHTLGRCNYLYGDRLPDGTTRRVARIDVTDLFEPYHLATKAVLWHEFCHAEKWVKDGTSDGHGKAWNVRCWRKPLLMLLDLTYTKVLFALCKRKT